MVAVNPTIMALDTRDDQIVGFFGVSLDGWRVAVCRDPGCQGHVFELIEVPRAAGAQGSFRRPDIRELKA